MGRGRGRGGIGGIRGLVWGGSGCEQGVIGGGKENEGRL